MCVFVLGGGVVGGVVSVCGFQPWWLCIYMVWWWGGFREGASERERVLWGFGVNLCNPALLCMCIFWGGGGRWGYYVFAFFGGGEGGNWWVVVVVVCFI